jgi:hypothetical protein
VAKTYARFAASPIGPALTVQNGGLILTTNAATADGARTAVSDVSHSSGSHGVEFVVWGDDALTCDIGIAPTGASLGTALGNIAGGLAWATHAGAVYSGGILLASGLPAVIKGDIVGISVDLAAGTGTFWRNGDAVHSRALPSSGTTWHFAASLHTPGGAGRLALAVNAGQWPRRSTSVPDWRAADAAVSTTRIAEADWLTAASDAPAHARFEGLLDPRTLTITSEIGFWPWGGEPPTGAGAAQVNAIDPDGVLDSLAQNDVGGASVWIGSIDLDVTASEAKRNDVLYSEDLEQAVWTKVNLVPIVANTAADAAGALTLDKIIANTVSGSHYVEQGFTLADNAIVSIACLVRKGEYDVARLGFACKNNSGPALALRFSTEAITVASQGTGNTAVVHRVENLGGGLYRMVLENIDVLTGTGTPRIRATLMDDAGATSFAGDDVKGTHHGAFQLVPGAELQPYVATADAPVSVAATGGVTRADASPVARFVLDRIESHDDTRKVLYLTDAHADLDESLTRGVFLPNVPALAWQAQPVVIGAVASVPCLRANSDGSVLWLADSKLAHVSAVMDRGDTMEAGTYALTSDAQQLTFTQPTVGPAVADVSSIGTGMAPATLAQAVTAMFDRIGKGSYSLEDLQAIDAASGYAGVGYYAGQPVPVRVALAQLMPSYGAWWWQDATGLLRFSRIVNPAGVASAQWAFDLDSPDFGEALVAQPDDAPNLSRRMGYRPNARPLQPGEFVTDLVDVPASRRDELGQPHRGIAYSAVPLAARYAHADTAAPVPSALWRQQDAQAEVDRVCGFYTVPRSLYLVRVPSMDAVPTPGQVGRIRYPRYGLADGKAVLVRKVDHNPATGAVELTLWG